MTLQDTLYRPGAVTDNACQPLSPMTASDEAYMARQTEALWYYGSLTRRSYGWMSPDEGSPYLSTSSVNTWVTFANGNGGTGLCRIPWYSQPGVTRIGMRATIAIDDNALEFLFAAASVSLITAVATKSSEYVQVQPTAGPPAGNWSTYGFQNQDRQLKLGTVAVELAPEYPASRRIALTVTGYWRALENPTALSVTRRAYIYSLQIWDIPPQPDGT